VNCRLLDADRGGNEAHLAPEILNSRPGPRGRLDYSKQPVWAAGVLAYELSGHDSPFKSGTIDQRGYGVDLLPPLETTYCSDSTHCQKLPAEFTKLVSSMLHPEPDIRPTLRECLDIVNKLN
jgi:serine/threonine protein kinase